ncbi:MAG: TetR/AcrR family transcriptional regulator [Sandaracinaceae bacterium]|nr:TetR/AcrR family transcriptional regulator [Sandaracinaceae bacterium]
MSDGTPSAQRSAPASRSASSTTRGTTPRTRAGAKHTASPSSAPESNGRRTQAERRTATIERLVEATITVLAEAGYAGASVKAICDRAGVSQGALFRHFDTRVDLLVRVVDEIGTRNVQSFVRAAGITDATWTLDRLDHFVNVLRTVSRSPTHAAWREVIAAARVEPDLADAVGAAVARFEAAIIRMVELGLPGTPEQNLETVTIVLSIMHMFDSEAVTVRVKPNPAIEAARITWATRVLRELYDRRAG